MVSLERCEPHLTSAVCLSASLQSAFVSAAVGPLVFPFVVSVPVHSSSGDQLHCRVNAHVDAVFVLSVKSFRDRIAHIERELRHHGIAFAWIFEHDADELTPQLIESTFAASDMGRPQQSLVLKHIETWRRCAESGYRRILVFEDDAMLAPDFETTFCAAMRAADMIDRPYMVYLGCGNNKYAPEAPGAGSPLIRTGVPLPATDAIVIDQRAARLRLEYIAGHRITRPADWLMREADAAMGIDHYWLADPIVEQGSMNGRFTSVLDRKRIRRGRVWSWLRYRWDRWRVRTLNRDRHAEMAEDISVASAALRRDNLAVASARAAAALVGIGTFTGAALANIAAGVMVLAFLTAPSCMQRIRRTWRQPLGKAAVLFLAVLLLSTLWSEAPFPVALKAWGGWRQFLILFIVLAVFDTRSAKLAFAAIFAVVATAGAVASFLAFDFGSAQAISDVKSGIILRNHVTQGMALTVGALLALVLLTHARRGSWQQSAWAASATLMTTNVVFVAYGRSGYVALAVASLAVALGLWRGRARGIALAVLILLTLSALQFSPLINQRFEKGMKEIAQANDAAELTSMGIRMVMWETTTGIVRDAPLFGHGLGSFSDEYRRRVTQRYAGWKATLMQDPHNQYLLVLAETGLLGLAMFTWWLFSAPRQPVQGPFRSIGLAILLAWCVTSLFSSHFHTFNEGHLIMIVLGVCLARERAEPGHERSAASIAARTSS